MLNWEKELIILKSRASVDDLDVEINNFIKEKFKTIFEKLDSCSSGNNESLINIFNRKDYITVLNDLKQDYLTD